MEAIKRHATALIDGTCYENYQRMTRKEANRTVFKTAAIAVSVGLIAALFAGTGFGLFVFAVSGVVAFTCFTYKRKSAPSKDLVPIALNQIRTRT